MGRSGLSIRARTDQARHLVEPTGGYPEPAPLGSRVPNFTLVPLIEFRRVPLRADS